MSQWQTVLPSVNCQQDTANGVMFWMWLPFVESTSRPQQHVINTTAHHRHRQSQDLCLFRSSIVSLVNRSSYSLIRVCSDGWQRYMGIWRNSDVMMCRKHVSRSRIFMCEHEGVCTWWCIFSLMCEMFVFELLVGGYGSWFVCVRMNEWVISPRRGNVWRKWMDFAPCSLFMCFFLRTRLDSLHSFRHSKSDVSIWECGCVLWNPHCHEYCEKERGMCVEFCFCFVVSRLLCVTLGDV